MNYFKKFPIKLYVLSALKKGLSEIFFNLMLLILSLPIVL